MPHEPGHNPELDEFIKGIQTLLSSLSKISGIDTQAVRGLVQSFEPIKQFLSERAAEDFISWDEVQSRFPDVPQEVFDRLRQQEPQGYRVPVTLRQGVLRERTPEDLETILSAPDIQRVLTATTEEVAPDGVVPTEEVVAPEVPFADQFIDALTFRKGALFQDTRLELSSEELRAARNFAITLENQKEGILVLARTELGAELAPEISMGDLLGSPEFAELGRLGFLPVGFGQLTSETVVLQEIINQEALENALRIRGRGQEIESQKQRIRDIVTSKIGQLPTVLDNPIIQQITKAITAKKRELAATGDLPLLLTEAQDRETIGFVLDEAVLGKLSVDEVKRAVELGIFSASEQGAFKLSQGALQDAARRAGFGSQAEFIVDALEKSGISPQLGAVQPEFEIGQEIVEKAVLGQRPAEIAAATEERKGAVREFLEAERGLERGEVGLTEFRATEAAQREARAGEREAKGFRLAKLPAVDPTVALQELDRFLLKMFPRARITLARRQFPLLFQQFGGAQERGVGINVPRNFTQFLEKLPGDFFTPFVSFPTSTPRTPRQVSQQQGLRIR